MVGNVIKAVNLSSVQHLEQAAVLNIVAPFKLLERQYMQGYRGNMLDK